MNIKTKSKTKIKKKVVDFVILLQNIKWFGVGLNSYKLMQPATFWQKSVL